MNPTTDTSTNVKDNRVTITSHRPSYRAYELLHFIFSIVPILMGLDKFFNYTTNWEQYLSPPFNVFQAPLTTMYVVWVVEIIVGLFVWIKPKIFAYIVALWLLAIIVNLLILGNFYDIILRDIALLFAALALGQLSHDYDV
jgi:hypothetical protein